MLISDCSQSCVSYFVNVTSPFIVEPARTHSVQQAHAEKGRCETAVHSDQKSQKGCFETAVHSDQMCEVQYKCSLQAGMTTFASDD